MNHNVLIAFWKYDSYPYILSGEVNDISEKGYVTTKEYGKGHQFNALIIVEKSIMSDTVQKNLKELEEFRNAALKKFETQWKNRLLNNIEFKQLKDHIESLK